MNNSTATIFNMLQTMFDLPDHIMELNLNLRTDSFPKLTVTYLPDLKTGNIETKKFEIKEIT